MKTFGVGDRNGETNILAHRAFAANKRSGRRFAIQCALIATVLFFAAGAIAQTTNVLSDAEVQGRALAQKILEQAPANNFTNTGILRIKDAKGMRTDVPVTCQTIVTETNWLTSYQASGTNGYENFVAIHTSGQPNAYFYHTNPPVPILGGIPYVGHLLPRSPELSDVEIMVPFAGSDFSLADLGLEFFRWPQQKVLPKTTNLKRGRDYTLLESTNPHPSANGYSRVVTWIDVESDGILEAEAYDATGKKLKDFYPKDFKKVDGQWQVQTLIMENVQTGSRSRLEFELSK
jgi:hypothetical protein